MHKTTEVERQTGRIEKLIQELESSADAGSLATARELVQSLMDLYAAGLERIAGTLAQKGPAGREILDELGRDDLVGNLLAANGLHPLGIEARVQRAVDNLGPRLRKQGAVELMGIDDGVIRMRLRLTGSGCGSSAGSVQSVVEEAMYDAAPDLVHLTIEVVEEQGAVSGFVPLEKLAGYRPALNGVSNGRGAGV